jgi:hypothetical protein
MQHNVIQNQGPRNLLTTTHQSDYVEWARCATKPHGSGPPLNEIAQGEGVISIADHRRSSHKHCLSEDTRKSYH